MDSNVAACMPASCLLFNNYWMRLSMTDSENYEGQGLCYLPKPKTKADITSQGLDNCFIIQL